MDHCQYVFPVTPLYRLWTAWAPAQAGGPLQSRLSQKRESLSGRTWKIQLTVGMIKTLFISS